MASAKNMVGEKFGRLTVVSFSCAKNGNAQWDCLCDCGNAITVSRPNLLSGNTQSCGCLNAELSSGRRKTHGHTAGISKGAHPSREYTIWASMITRCRYHVSYKGRGITVCKRWECFENFYKDMGDRPDGHSIDRINNDLGYSPENCRWASSMQQSRNRRSSVNITYGGVKMTLAAWSEFTKISYNVIQYRRKVQHQRIGVALGFE